MLLVISEIISCPICSKPFAKLPFHLNHFHKLETASNEFQCLMAFSSLRSSTIEYCSLSRYIIQFHYYYLKYHDMLFQFCSNDKFKN